MADIPGLIEGAAQGVGLGHEFLRHIRRTRLLVHMIDGSAIERDPWQDFETINHELLEYDKQLSERPQVVVLNKMDIPETQERWPEFQAKAQAANYPVFAISAAAHQGTDDLMTEISRLLLEMQRDEAERAAAEVIVDLRDGESPILRPQPDDAFTVTVEDGVYVVRGRRVERMVNMTNQDSEESMDRMQVQLEKMGVTKALDAAGVKVGDTVRFGKAELFWGE
jgi:GTP-binding protein